MFTIENGGDLAIKLAIVPFRAICKLAGGFVLLCKTMAQNVGYRRHPRFDDCFESSMFGI